MTKDDNILYTVTWGPEKITSNPQETIELFKDGAKRSKKPSKSWRENEWRRI